MEKNLKTVFLSLTIALLSITSGQGDIYSDELPGGYGQTSTPASPSQPQPNQKLTLGQLQAQAQGASQGQSQATSQSQAPLSTATAFATQNPSPSSAVSTHQASSDQSQRPMSMQERLAAAQRSRIQKHVRFASSSFGSAIGRLSEDKTARYLDLVSRLDQGGLDALTAREQAELEALYSEGTVEPEEDPYDGMSKEAYEFWVDIAPDLPGKGGGYIIPLVFFGTTAIGLGLGLWITHMATESKWAKAEIDKTKDATHSWATNLEGIIISMRRRNVEADSKTLMNIENAYKVLKAYHASTPVDGSDRIAQYLAARDFVVQSIKELDLEGDEITLKDELLKSIDNQPNHNSNKWLAGLRLTDSDVERSLATFKGRAAREEVVFDGDKVGLAKKGSTPGTGIGMKPGGERMGPMDKREAAFYRLMEGARDRVYGDPSDLREQDDLRRIDDANAKAAQIIDRMNRSYRSEEEKAAAIRDMAENILAGGQAAHDLKKAEQELELQRRMAEERSRALGLAPPQPGVVMPQAQAMPQQGMSQADVQRQIDAALAAQEAQRKARLAAQRKKKARPQPSASTPTPASRPASASRPLSGGSVRPAPAARRR